LRGSLACGEQRRGDHDTHLCRVRLVAFSIGDGVINSLHMSSAKETTLREVGEMLTHVGKHMVTKENLEAFRSELKGDIAHLRTEMIDQFEHADKQFEATRDRLRDMAAEIAVIHRRVERLEEQGASNAGFAKEIDHLLTRVAEIERHLGIDKKIAA
jgi:predicted nuclease with TOPRIM domain